MTFETFKVVYFFVCVVTTTATFWWIRKQRNDLLVIALMSVVMFMLFLALYLDSAKDDTNSDFSEFLFRALTHVKGDIVLSLCNVLLWGAVPFALAVTLNKKRHGSWLVWTFFLGMTALKTKFDDFFLIHNYPESMSFSTFEWGYVFVAWLVIYSGAALFITKGTELLKETTK